MTLLELLLLNRNIRQFAKGWKAGSQSRDPISKCWFLMPSPIPISASNQHRNTSTKLRHGVKRRDEFAADTVTVIPIRALIREHTESGGKTRNEGLVDFFFNNCHSTCSVKDWWDEECVGHPTCKSDSLDPNQESVDKHHASDHDITKAIVK